MDGHGTVTMCDLPSTDRLEIVIAYPHLVDPVDRPAPHRRPVPADLSFGTALRRQWRIAILPLAILVPLALVLGSARTPVYSAASRVSVGGLDITNPQVLASGGPAESLAGVFTRALNAPEVIVPLRAQLRSGNGTISGSPIAKSNIFVINATADSRAHAVKLANDATAAVIAYANTLRKANSAKLATALRDAARESYSANRRVGRLQGKDPSTVSHALDEARADARVLSIRVQSLNAAYRTDVQASGGQPLLQVFASARGAASDRRSKLELLLLIAVVAGSLAGASLAVIRSRRMLRRAQP
jgi:hypothetical protein